MNSNLKYALGALLFFVILLVLIFRIDIQNAYYNFVDYKHTKNTITWSEDRKLTWSDFNYEPNNQDSEVSSSVWFSIRYNEEVPILFRSKTIFMPEKSTISDTTNPILLQKAQLKFDLLELYRRKMTSAIDSLRELEIADLKPSDFEKLSNDFYNEFRVEWNMYDQLRNPDSLTQIENQIWLLIE